MKNSMLIAATMILISQLFACAPKPDESQTSEPTVEFGPRHQDAPLDLSQLNEQTKAQSKNWQKSEATSPEEKLDFLEHLLELDQSLNTDFFSSAAVAEVRNFRQSHQAAPQKFDSSPYIDAIVGATHLEVRDQIARAEKFLPEDEAKIVQFLERSRQEYLWPRIPLKFEHSILGIQNYIDWMLGELPFLGLNQATLDSLQSEVPRQAEQSLTQLKAEMEKVFASENSLQTLQNIQSMLQTVNYELSGESRELMKTGLDISKNVQAIRDEQDILTVLVKIWKLLDDKERKEIFRSESKDLYEFLSESDEHRLKCLERRDCSRDWVVWLGKKVKIIPEIKKRGVRNLRNQIDSSMREYVLAKVEAEFTEALPVVPGMIAAEVQSAIHSKIKELQEIKNDYAEYVKKMADKWASKKLSTFSGQVRGLEVLSSRESSASLLGQGLLVKTRILNQQNRLLNAEEKTEWALEHLNKLLAVGGYRNDKVAVRALALPLDLKNSETRISLQEILRSKFSFAVPDRFHLTGPYTGQPLSQVHMNVSVVGQARLLRGFSESIRFMKDWSKTSFDQILGNEKLGQVLDEAPGNLADRQLFPKETLMALSVGNAALILKNLLKDLSPVFVVGQESRIIWANEYQVNEAEAAAMAGVVNLIAGQRDIKVQATDVAEYLIALTDFIKSIEGIENTRSEYLIEQDAEGQRPLDELLAAKNQIKLLVVGLANFISHKMVGSDAWVHEVFALKTNSIEDGETRIMTQFRAIRALLKAYELTGLEPYKWSAMDLYYRLNAQRFDAAKAFYQGVENLQDGVEVLRTLKELEPHLPASSQGQMRKLLDSWLVLVKTRLS